MEQKQLDDFILRAGFSHGWENLESQARRMAEHAVEEIARLQALSVTNILIAVVPGEDGMGEEVYAQSVEDIYKELTDLSERAEEARAQAVAVRAKLNEVHSWIVCAAIASPDDMMQSAARIEEITRPE